MLDVFGVLMVVVLLVVVVLLLIVSCDLCDRTEESEQRSCACDVVVFEKSLRRCARSEVASDSMLSKLGLSGGSAVDVLLITSLTLLAVVVVVVVVLEQRILYGSGEPSERLGDVMSLGCVLRRDAPDGDTEAAERMSVSPGSGANERFLGVTPVDDDDDEDGDEEMVGRDCNVVKTSHIFLRVVFLYVYIVVVV